MDFNGQKTPSDSSSPSSPSKLVLYSYWQSSCSWRVRFALNVKGLSYEYKSVNLVKGEQFSPGEFRDLYLTTSVDISREYLEEKYPQKALLPLDPRLKAVNLQAASIISSSIQPLQMLSVLKYIEEKVGREERLSWAVYYVEKGFFALEKLLEDCVGRYATGEEVYMADVFLAPQIAIAIARIDIDMSKFPLLSRIYESCKALPEFQASSPERQPDAAQ
ncbi:hypothetical protein L1049_018477 [Liquidambar formosana]|uniref:Glutathione transferase n=1 Tax=Liquidambar formosana TaxID=63359 RepID=A0AAP0WLS0_LIQFO